MILNLLVIVLPSALYLGAMRLLVNHYQKDSTHV